MNLLVLDFETFYSKEYSLKRMSTPEYILDPRFEVFMLAAWDVLNWPGPRIIEGPDVPKFFKETDPQKTIAVAHNALFDMSVCAWRYGWIPKVMLDTLGMARALSPSTRPITEDEKAAATIRGYPESKVRPLSFALGALAERLLGYDSKKDHNVLGQTAGMTARQIKQMGLWTDMRAYAMNDVRLCAHIYGKLAPQFPKEERAIMDLVLRTTIEPVLEVNAPLLQTHLIELRQKKQELLDKGGYNKALVMSSIHFQKELEKLGVEVQTKLNTKGQAIPAFAKTDKFMSDLLEWDTGDEETDFKVQTLANARLSHKSTLEETRTERFLKIAQLPWPQPNLLPMPLRYGGAHTHRLSGEWKMNVQNLTRSQKKSKLRTSLIAPPGFKLLAADLSQIEARMVAVLAGQEDLIEQFASGKDVYSIFASTVFGRTIDKNKNPIERFIGKTGVLGLGYGCGHIKFNKMVTTQARMSGISLEGIFNEELAKTTVTKYRSVYPEIPELWRMFDQAKDMIFSKTKSTMPLGPVTITGGRIRLPNGLDLFYGDWQRETIWGGVLLENVSQALARIVIMQTAVRLARQGYRFVLQAHDELVFCVREGIVNEAKEMIMQEMVRPVSWLPRLPLAAEIGIGNNYGECK